MSYLRLVVLVLTMMSCSAFAGEQSLFYLAAGNGTGGANFSIGAGTNVDVLEISSIKLNRVDGSNSARFVGLSLVQHSIPVSDFSLMFRLGFGKTTTTFANGSSASKMGLGNGVILGLGAQYQPNPHLALRAEMNHITYAASADGLSSGETYPITLSALCIF